MFSSCNRRAVGARLGRRAVPAKVGVFLQRLRLLGASVTEGTHRREVLGGPTRGRTALRLNDRYSTEWMVFQIVDRI